MRAVLTQQGVVDAIDPPEDGDELSIHVVSKQVDAKAKSLLIMHVEDHLLLMIENASSARDAWLKLERTHRQKNAARITVLKREMSRLTMSETDGLEKLQQKLMEYQEELIAAGYQISNGELLQVAADALPSRFDTHLALLEHQMDAEGMELDDFFARLQLADSRMNSRNTRRNYSDENEAEANLSAADMRSGRSRKPGKPNSNGQTDTTGKVGEQPGGDQRYCDWCNKPGHDTLRCYFYRRARDRARERQTDSDKAGTEETTHEDQWQTAGTLCRFRRRCSYELRLDF